MTPLCPIKMHCQNISLFVHRWISGLARDKGNTAEHSSLSPSFSIFLPHSGPCAEGINSIFKVMLTDGKYPTKNLFLVWITSESRRSISDILSLGREPQPTSVPDLFSSGYWADKNRTGHAHCAWNTRNLQSLWVWNGKGVGRGELR